MHDKRLLGIWKSDKERTFRDYTFKPGIRKKTKKRFKRIFGKLTLRYTRTRAYFVLNRIETWHHYRVLAKDNTSVAILLFPTQSKDEEFLANARAALELEESSGTISHIHFEGEHCWVNVGARFIEFFRRAPLISRKKRRK